MKKTTVVAGRVELILVMPYGSSGSIRQLVCTVVLVLLPVLLRSIWNKMKCWIGASIEKLLLRLLSCPLF